MEETNSTDKITLDFVAFTGNQGALSTHGKNVRPNNAQTVLDTNYTQSLSDKAENWSIESSMSCVSGPTDDHAMVVDTNVCTDSMFITKDSQRRRAVRADAKGKLPFRNFAGISDRSRC